MADYGLKVSRDGYDVLSATDKQLALKSSLNLLKVKMAGSTTVIGTATKEITHGLGYVPQFFAFGEIQGFPDEMRWGCASDSYSLVRAGAGTAKLYMRIYNGSGTNVYDLYYYIFHDAA